MKCVIILSIPTLQLELNVTIFSETVLKKLNKWVPFIYIHLQVIELKIFTRLKVTNKVNK